MIKNNQTQMRSDLRKRTNSMKRRQYLKEMIFLTI